LILYWDNGLRILTKAVKKRIWKLDTSQSEDFKSFTWVNRGSYPYKKGS